MRAGNGAVLHFEERITMTEVIMPKMGDGMEEGTLVEWLIKDGDKVKAGQVIGTIQTDKATLELESPGGGFFAGALIQAGATVPVGVPIAALLKEGEKLPANWGSGESSAPATAEVEPEKVAVAASSSASAPAVSGKSDRIKASPLARKVAEALGVDLASIAGSGPGGRIVEEDVRKAGGSPAKAPAAAVAQVIPAAEDTKVPLNNLRKIIAQRTQHSKSTVPHFYVTLDVDLEKIYALRELFELEESGKVSVNDFVVKACAKALSDMPEVNATFQGDSVLRYSAVHIGIAAAVDDGLLVPVIKNAQAKSLRELSVDAKSLVKKARDGKLHPDEMSGSTFSISNMGMLNVDSFAAIINEPNAAIIAIGTARKKAIVDEDTDEIEVRWRMNITASFDHRVIDGAVGAKFANLVKDYLENPTRLLG
jgi:pyruvate dehydrogenase E2 component (dihydrolipoamide acetyltransferase)